MCCKKSFKTAVISILAFAFLFFSMPAAAAAGVEVMLDDTFLSFDVSPIIENGRTMVPFRAIGEALGARVSWDQETQTVTAVRDDRTIQLQIGNFTAYINQSPVNLDVPPKIVNSRTLVPLRFFSEAFGAAVLWDDTARTVLINSQGKPSKHIMGFYYSQSYEDFLQNMDKLSSIAVKWYTIDDNGKLTDKDTKRYINVPQGYEEVIKQCKEKGIKIHMLVFENSKEKLKKILSTSQSRQELVKQIISVVENENYDGVNLDFENLHSGDKSAFNEFVKILYENLKSRGYSLSISLPAKTREEDWWPGYDYKELGKYCDIAVLMAYDKNPAKPGPQSGLDWVEEVVDYAISHIPAEKVVLGIGYYGYDWANGLRRAIIAKNNGATYLKFADELTEKYGLNLKLDPESRLLYGNYVDENGITHQVWMESAYSVDSKAKMAIRKNIKGVALWRLGYTDNAFWDALLQNFDPEKIP